MRHNLPFRATRTVSLVIFLLGILYLSRSDRVHIPSLNSSRRGSHPDAALSESIQVFWSHWAKIFHDRRPTSEGIYLDSYALASAIWADPYGPRKPDRNRVLNPESDIESLRLSHAAFLKTLQSENVVGDMFNGTGVVMMGGGQYFGPAIVGLHMLRKTGSTLPVEIFVADEREYEPKICDNYLPRFGARCLILSRFFQNRASSQSFEVKHFQLKSLAMLFSSFAEVLYLDSDSIPLLDPSTELFSAEPYLSSGLVVWPDFWISTESPLFYTIAGLPGFPAGLPKTSSEAGQLMINKTTHLKTLLLALYYNIYGPDYYYPLLSQGAMGEGDKETFMAAALVLGAPYYRIKTPVEALGRHDGGYFKGSAMLQHHPSDDMLHGGPQNTRDRKEKGLATVRPAFVHANAPKMNAAHLLDEGALISVDKKRLRLWGDRDLQENFFGYDLEKTVWELLLETGCELEQVMREWKSRDRICGRLEEHWKAVFVSSSPRKHGRPSMA